MADVAETTLAGILLASMVLAVVLILVSAGAMGRKLSDLEYQKEAGIDGVRMIQSQSAVRVHVNRVLLGAVFVVFSTLLLAGAPLELRTWSFRLMFLVLLADFVASAILDWRGERRQVKLLMSGEVEDKRVATEVTELRAQAATAAKKAEIDDAVTARVGTTQETAATVAKEVAATIVSEMESVDVATIQPEAVADIADAVRPPPEHR